MALAGAAAAAAGQGSSTPVSPGRNGNQHDRNWYFDHYHQYNSVSAAAAAASAAGEPFCPSAAASLSRHLRQVCFYLGGLGLLISLLWLASGAWFKNMVEQLHCYGSYGDTFEEAQLSDVEAGSWEATLPVLPAAWRSDASQKNQNLQGWD